MTETHRWLFLCLEAPLLSFGGVAIDAVRPTEDFPAQSMLTGLIANALGWDRKDGGVHQELQDRIVFAARLDRIDPLRLVEDTQNVQMEKSDRGWTTRGLPEGRGGNSYGGPHRRFRDYHADAAVSVVLRLRSGGSKAMRPSLDEVAEALDRPARPLFIGRKCCLPSAPIHRGSLAATTARHALASIPADVRNSGLSMRAMWPEGEGPDSGVNVERIATVFDLRDWRAGFHGGSRRVVYGRVDAIQEDSP